MKKLIFSIVAIGFFFLLTTIAFAWEKDGGISCSEVFAKIRNDNAFRYSGSRDGYAKYVRTETDGDGNSDWEWKVGPTEGDVAANGWVTVSWTPPAGFVGDVEVLAGIYKNQSSQDPTDTGDYEDYKKLTGHLNCPAPTPTLTPSPTPTPTVEVTPTPTPTLEVTPTPTPEPEVTPTPTPVPECTENCGTPPTFAPSSTVAPSCPDGSTTNVVANPHVWRNGEAATVNFFITEGDSANIFYSVVGQPHWQYAVADVKPNADKFVSYTIHGLNPALGYDFGIQQKQGCGGGKTTAVVVDGPTPTLFMFSYWE